MSGWVADMANAVDAHEAAPAPPMSKASGPPSMPAVSINDTPTEPATTPRVSEVPVQRWAQELQLPTLEHGPREEPERFATRYILNDGTMTQEAHDALLRKAAQAFNNRDMDREIEAAIQREKEAHERSIKEWEARIAAPRFRIIRLFHVVHPQQELHLCVHFRMSMQLFVRMIPLRLHILNQSSRRLHRLWEGRYLQASTLTRNLQGLVLQCSLHHQ